MIPAVHDFLEEARRYRSVAEKAIAQVSDENLNRVLASDGNSVAMLVRHLSGNMVSRFTDFLTSDGDKPWRHRDSEFEAQQYSRADVAELWEKGWTVLEAAVIPLTQDDLAKTITIRSVPLTVQQALFRAAAHLAYHSGQIVLLARIV